MTYVRIVLAAGALVATVAAAQAQMMGGHQPPVPMTAAEFAAAQTGQSVQIAVRVERRTRETLVAELLQHESETRAKRTGTHVTLYLPESAPVVMGTAADIVPGAVLFVYGVATKRGQVDVKRAVVDTKFVKVE
jgi:hypothetical protein